jgi:hypothetical protein
MVMSRDQNAGQNHNIKISNKSFERVKQFTYLGTTLSNENCIHEEIMCRLKSGNACYLSVQNLSSSSLLSRNIKITLGVKFGLTLGVEHRPRVFENRVPRKIFRAKRDDITQDRGEWHNEELHHLYASSNIIGLIKTSGMRWEGHVARIGDRRCIQGFGGET